MSLSRQSITLLLEYWQMTTKLTTTKKCNNRLDGCIVWNAYNAVLGEEARLIYIVPVCYIKTGRYGKPSNVIISLLRKKFQL